MRDEDKTREQLIQEIRDLRRELIELKTGSDKFLSTRQEVESCSLDEAMSPVLNDSTEELEPTPQDPYVSGAFAALLSDDFHARSLTETGSFDLRWITMASFGRLIHAIPMPILLADISGTIEFANNAFLRFCEDRPPESLYSLFPDHRVIPVIRDMMDTLLRKRKPLVREGLIRIGCTELWSRMNFRPIRFGGERSILVLIEDLTSVKREITLNQKYKILVDIFPIGIAEFALEHPAPTDGDVDEILSMVLRAKVIETNGTFASSCGLQSVDDLRGMTLDQLLKHNYIKYHRSWIESRFAVRPFETVEDAGNGKLDYFENTLVGNVQDDLLARFWVMKQDITERKKVEADLIEKIKTIDELYEHIFQSREAKVIADHTARVAHELRQPLVIIGGFARRMAKETAQSGKVDRAAQNEAFEIIVKEVQRLEKILGRLIDFTKREPINLQSVNPDEVVEYVVRINQWRIKEKGLKVELQFGRDIGNLLLDSDKFQEVVRNLLSHAVEVSPRGEKIRVSTGISMPSRKALQTGELDSERYFELKIHYSGESIDAADMEEILDPFVSTMSGGNLGLQISRKIVEEHRGSISATSDDTGAHVTVWLPLIRRAQ